MTLACTLLSLDKHFDGYRSCWLACGDPGELAVPEYWTAALAQSESLTQSAPPALTSLGGSRYWARSCSPTGVTKRNGSGEANGVSTADRESFPAIGGIGLAERSFAKLCGVSPFDASSGKQIRHRLNRGGDRQTNVALWRIVLVRLRSDPATRDYID